MQCARINAKVEEAYQHSIEQGGSPIPQAAETPRRRPERRIQQNYIPKSPKPVGKLDVFHQRNVGETTQVLKDRCSNEDGLVSKQWSHQRIQAPNQNFPQDHTGPAIVEATMEGAACDCFVSGGLFQCGNVFGPQLGIGVMTAE